MEEMEEIKVMYNCMTCNHPICPMKNKAEHYCGNYVMSKPYTLKLVLGGTKGEQSTKDRVCAMSLLASVFGSKHK